jgi:hypothetical protein
MTIYALAKLKHRSEQMTAKLAFGTKTEIAAARELLRQSLVELYELGHWLQHPDEMRKYMRLYRICGPDYISVPESRSAPDRMGQCSP